jgi:hypothetical protein
MYQEDDGARNRQREILASDTFLASYC